MYTRDFAFASLAGRSADLLATKASGAKVEQRLLASGGSAERDFPLAQDIVERAPAVPGNEGVEVHEMASVQIAVSARVIGAGHRQPAD